MSFLFNLIRAVLEWGIFLALVGGLGEATATLYLEAGHARAHGLVSLRALNQGLVGSTSKPHPVHPRR